jgi:hypothetical protein
MNDSRTAAFQEAGTIGWDLEAAEVSYPINVEFQGRTFEVYVALRQPYDSDELIQGISKARGGYRRQGGNLQNVVGDDAAFAELVDSLFLRMDGTSAADPAEQRKYLDRNPQLKPRIIRAGLGGIQIQAREELSDPTPADDLDVLPIALDVASDLRTPVTQALYIPALKKKVTISMGHVTRPETEKDWKRWSRTSSEQYTRSNNLWTEGVNWHARAQLYDEMIKRVDGMYLGRVPCDESNKAAWLSKIPIWHKFLVINTVFDETSVKN